MLRFALTIAVCISATGAYAQMGCEDEKTAKATDSDVATKVQFNNKSAAAVKVYWLDFDGKRQFYSDVAPGDSYIQDTFMTHPWLVTTLKDECIMMFRPLPGSTEATVTAQ